MSVLTAVIRYTFICADCTVYVDWYFGTAPIYNAVYTFAFYMLLMRGEIDLFFAILFLT